MKNKEKENHTYPMDIVRLSEEAVDPIDYVECSIRTAFNQIQRILSDF